MGCKHVESAGVVMDAYVGQIFCAGLK